MGEWKEYRLGDIAEVQTGPFGSQLHASDYVASGIPTIMPTNIGGRLDIKLDTLAFVKEKDVQRLIKYAVHVGDIVYSRRGDVEKCAFIKKAQDGWLCGTGCLRIRCHAKEVIPQFCAYYLSTPEIKAWVSNSAVGTTMPNLNSKVLGALPLFIPPLREQKSIASILSSLDDKIDLFHRQNKTLEALAETLFRQWFVEEVEELETKTLDELIVFDPRERVNGGVEYTFFDMKCLSDSTMAIADGIKRTVNSGSSFRNGDTLLAKITPCLENGKTGFVMNLDEVELARGSTEFIVMRAKEGVSPYFVYCLARYSDFRNTAILSMTGTSGRQRVQTAELKNYTISYSEDVMKRFHSLCHLHFLKIRQNQTQIHTLTRLRDTLLPKLMSGEVRVKEPLCGGSI